MARPRPVPPYFRDVEVSAWTKGWKISSSLVRRDADTGVRHFDMDDGLTDAGGRLSR